MHDGKYEKKWLCRSCLKKDKMFAKEMATGKYDAMHFPKEIGFCESLAER